jgi:ketosteroid isomerase-like protein
MSGLAVIALLACAQNAQPPDTAADVDAINQVREREIAAFSGGDIDGVLAVFATDALIMPPNEPAVNGHDAMRTWAQGMWDQFTVSGRYASSNVTVAGDWAIEQYTGSLTLTPKAGGVAMEEQFKGIHIYRRQPDGSWVIVQDIWNSNAPPPAPAPTTTGQ